MTFLACVRNYFSSLIHSARILKNPQKMFLNKLLLIKFIICHFKFIVFKKKNISKKLKKKNM